MHEPEDKDASISSFVRQLVDPWYISLAKPKESQEAALRSLLAGYAKTAYGQQFKAEKISSLGEFQASFPVANYATLEPYIERVKLGDYSTLLPEPVSHWVMTRGTTGRAKVIPTTESHISQILTVGARAIVNFALKKDIVVLTKNVLNLNFPSEVQSITTPSGDETRFGYSSGTYAKLHPSLEETSLVPRQEEIDTLGGGISRADWERRFELVYDRARSSNVGSVMGVTPVLISFAEHLRRKHHTVPRQLWKMNALFCTSVAKIHSKYGPSLKHYYGDLPVVEMYTATEGVFAQQLDDLPYVSPNYDAYLFEVMTGRGAKMLHDMRPNEWGRVVVSSTLFPRYDIGDFIECIGKGYFRVFGRAKKSVALEHVLYNVLAGRL